MAKKKVTAKPKAGHTGSGDYGSPIYMTINASNNYYLAAGLVAKAVEEAAEYKSVLYLTVNSGNPPFPPVCPPGDPKCQG